MTFEEKLNAILEEIEIPKELAPENIEAMLMNVAQETEKPQIAMTTTRSAKRVAINRTIAAVAACIAVVVSCSTYSDVSTKTIEIEQASVVEETIEYKAVQEVDSYDELYNLYTGIYERSAGTDVSNGDGEEISEVAETVQTTTATAVVTEAVETATITTTEQQTQATTTTAIETEASVVETTVSEEEIAEEIEIEEGISFDTAIVSASGDGYSCYVVGNVLYVVDENSDIFSSNELSFTPNNIYCQGNVVVLLGEENVSDTYTVADVYIVGDDTTEHIEIYKQNGNLSDMISLDGDTLYMITTYTGDTAPNGDSLESYVPSYYVDDEKNYVSASDIVVTSSASNVEYTIISAINYTSGNVSTKAVLGSAMHTTIGNNCYFTNVSTSGNAIYTTVTIVNKSSEIAYIGTCLFEGILLSADEIVEHQGYLYIATCTDVNGYIATNISKVDMITLETITTYEEVVICTVPTLLNYNGEYVQVCVNDSMVACIDLLTGMDVLKLDTTAVVENTIEVIE